MTIYPRPTPRPPDDPRGPWDALRAVYKKLRIESAELEHLIQHATEHDTLDEATMKRLDKALVVMKVGFKILKKAARQPAVVAVIEEIKAA